MKIEVILGELFCFELRTDIFGCIKRAVKTVFKCKECGEPVIKSDYDGIEEFAEAYEEQAKEYYDSQNIRAINDNVERFTNDLKVDADGLYDVPPQSMTEVEEFMEDVEIIDDAFEKAMETKLKSVRGV